MRYCVIGEDPPTSEDIDVYGLYHACQMTSGNFALYASDLSMAARGRVGTSPMYWDGEGLSFSFFITDKTPLEFPVGHLFDRKQNRLVCWDSMYFDKPLATGTDVVRRLKTLIKNAVEKLDSKTDAFIFTRDYGSMIINKYIDENKWAYTIVNDDEETEDVIASQNMVVVCCEHFPSYMKKYHADSKKFITSLGCAEIFDSDPMRFKPEEFTRLSSEYLKYGLEIYSPFLDNDVLGYVLDMTTPSDRPELLKKLFQEEE